MPPKKASRSEAEASTSSKKASGTACLTAAFIKSATDSNLLERLLTCSTALEGMPSASGHTFDKGFVEEISRRTLLNHPTTDVRIVTGLILAEIARVAASATTGPGAASGFPVKTSAVKDVVSLWLDVIVRLKNVSAKSTVTDYICHLVEVLGTSHALAGLLAIANVSADAVTAMFDALLESLPTDTDDAVAHAAATIIADCITAVNSVSETQLQVMMNAVAAKNTNPVGFTVVATVLRRQEDTVQSALATFITGAFTDACETLHKIDVVGTDGTDRKFAVRRVNGVANLLPEVAKASPIAVQSVLPAMAALIETTEHTECRSQLVGALGSTFLAVPALASDHLTAFGQTIGSINDVKALVRLTALNVAVELLKTHSSSEAFWSTLSKPIQRKLLDSDEGVRKATITAIAALARHAAEHIPASLIEALGQRCIDKRPAVRALAIDSLAGLYRDLRGGSAGSKLRFAPIAILASVHLEGSANLSNVDAAISAMLPNPSRTIAVAADKAKKAQAKKKTKKESFDFEDDVADAGAPTDSGTANSFVAGLVNVCSDTESQSMKPSATRTHFEALERLMSNRVRLRSAVQKFVELRAAVKREAEGSEARKQIGSQLIRLITFLGTATHAKGDEWGNLLKMKDEKAVKALAHLCSEDCTDYRSASADTLSRIKNCTSKDVGAFVEKNVMPRLAIPLCAEHVTDALTLLDKSGDNHVAVLRAVFLMGSAAPQLVHGVVEPLVDLLAKDVKQANKEREPGLMQILKILSLIRVGNQGDVPDVVADRSSDIISSLGKICLQARNPALAKRAILCLGALFPKTKKAYAQLFKTLMERLSEAASGTADNLHEPTASWVKTLQVLCRDHTQVVASHSEEIVDAVSRLLLIALQCAGDDVDTLQTKSKRTPPLSEVDTPMPQLADCCVKCLTAHCLSIPNASLRTPRLNELAEAIFAGFAATRQLGSGTVGASLKRLALHKQLVKLFLVNGLDQKLQLKAAMYLSAEHNAYVRSEVQKRIRAHIQRGAADMRLFGVLCLTGLSEDSRLTYSNARALVHAAGDRLRQVQAQNPNVTLSDVRALLMFPEYAIPFIVQVLAHHTFFDSEAESHFVGFQRVWHLLFDEVLRNGTQAVPFITDLLRKLRTYDDALDPTSPKTRTMCDLAIRVLTAILSQRTAGTETVKSYPGAILLPATFVVPRDPSLLPADKVYLSEAVHVAPQVQFRVAAAKPQQAADSDADGAPGDSDVDDFAVEDELATGPPTRDLFANTPAPKSQGGAARSKSRRAPTPPPAAASPVPATSSSAAASAKKGGKKASLRGASTPLGAEGANTIEGRIERLVQEECSGLSTHQMKRMRFNRLCATLSEKLDIEMSNELQEHVLQCLKDVIEQRSDE